MIPPADIRKAIRIMKMSPATTSEEPQALKVLIDTIRELQAKVKLADALSWQINGEGGHGYRVHELQQAYANYK